MKMQKQNLEMALVVAIANQGEQEQRAGLQHESALVQGWREILKASEAGERIEIVDES